MMELSTTSLLGSAGLPFSGGSSAQSRASATRSGAFSFLPPNSPWLVSSSSNSSNSVAPPHRPSLQAFPPYRKLLVLSYALVLIPLVLLLLRGDKVARRTMLVLTSTMLIMATLIAFVRRRMARDGSSSPAHPLLSQLNLTNSQSRLQTSAALHFMRMARTDNEVGSRLNDLAARLSLLMTDRDFDGNDYDELLALDSQHSSSQAVASDVDIRKLPTHVMSTSDVLRERNRGKETASCPVCLEAWESGDSLRTLPCLHRMHTQCIDPWLKQNATCPVCKFPATG